MANTNMSHSDVKSIVNSLECSPSKHDSAGKYGGAPSLTVTGKEGATAGSEKTSEFKMTDRGKTIAGYSGKFAKKAPQF